MLQKFLSYLFLLSASVGVTVAVMIYGWGLHPQSWWWIIGGGIVAQTVFRLIADRIAEEKTN